MKVMPKSCCLGEGLFPAKDSNRWVLRGNSQGCRAAVGPLGFCLNFILLLGEREQRQQCFAGGKQGGLVWLCPVGLCPPHVASWGSVSPPAGCMGRDPSPPLPREGEKILLCYPI